MGALAVGGVRVAAAVVAAGLLLTATACGERSEPTGPSIRLYPVTVASAGDRPLVVRKPARRIVVLAQGPYEIVAALGARSRIAGRPVARNGLIRFRQLKRLKPDLIVASSGANEVELSRAEAVTHAPVYVIPGDSIREVERAVIQLGLIAGRPVAARRLVHAIEAGRRFVARRLTRTRPVSVFVDTGFFTTVSDQSLAGDLIREAHGRNVAGPRPEPGPFDLRELVALDPDVYLATSDSGTTLAVLRRNARTRKLTAVRAGRFAIVDPALLEPGPRIGEGLLEIARSLHPDAFR